MSRSILLIGEGTRDIGKVDGKRTIGCDFEGDLPRLLRRLVGRVGYQAVTFDGATPQPIAGPATRTGGKAQILRAAILAQLRADPPPLAILAVLDATAAERDDLTADAAEIVRQAKAFRSDIPVVIGIAVHEIEIWMLADEVARQAAFAGAQGPVALARELEAIPDPKSIWATLAGSVALPPDRDPHVHADQQRAAAWQALRPEVVAERCPAFARLVEDASALPGPRNA